MINEYSIFNKNQCFTRALTSCNLMTCGIYYQSFLSKHIMKRKQPRTGLDCFLSLLGNKEVFFFYKIFTAKMDHSPCLSLFKWVIYNISISSYRLSDQRCIDLHCSKQNRGIVELERTGDIIQLNITRVPKCLR